MRRPARLVFAFLAIALTGIVSGAFLQRNHAFMPLRRFFQGRPVSVPPPAWSILDWDLAWKDKTPYQYRLRDLSFAELERNRSRYLTKLEEVLRLPAIPQGFSSRVRTQEVADLGPLRREKIEIETEPGLWVPFYVFIPKGLEKPAPAILVFHGHSSGKIETAGIVDSDQRGNALALAQAGFVTVAPDFRGFGELGWSGEWEDEIGYHYARSIHIQDALHNIAVGRTLLGTYIHDNRKILAYVKTRKEVDPKRIGVTGTSMGADVAIWFAVLNPEIKVIVAAGSPFQILRPKPRDFSEFHPCIHTIPEIDRFFRMRELPLLLAPRPFLIDLNKVRFGAPLFESWLETLYRETGNTEKFRIRDHREGDVYHNTAAIRWFKRWL